MKKIKLTQGKYALVDDEDFDYLNQWKWLYKEGYAARRPWNKEEKKYYWVRMHRLLNKTPDGFFTDHINQNSLDNRKSNLRTVTTQQNAFNSRLYSTNRSGHKGIYWDKVNKKWRVAIMVNYKTVRLGRFKDIKEAIKVRKAAEKIYHEIRS